MTSNRVSWYQERDDRTNRVNELSSSIDGYSVEVIYNLNENNTNNETFLEMFLNILARWCRTIKLYDINNVLDNKCRLKYASYALSIDPFINFQIIDAKGVNMTSSIVIGNTIQEYSNLICVNADNWICGIGKGLKIDTVKPCNNIVGVAFAACLGNAILFKQYLGANIEDLSIRWFSLYDFEISSEIKTLSNPGIPDSIEFGKLLQIGCGAVGSSVLYLLSKFIWTGQIDLIDFDHVNIPNCSSTLLFSAADAFEHRLKIDCAKSLSIKDRIRCTEGDYSSFVSNNSTYRPDILLCLANERNIWSTIQNNYPPIVLHATTNDSWGVNMGRHLPLKEWCIMCRFRNSIKTEMHPPCGNSILSSNSADEEILGVLPFLSPASAVLIVSEMIRLASGFVINSNFVTFSMKLNNENLFQKLFRVQDKECPVCNSQYSSIYQNVCNESKFWKYSN